MRINILELTIGASRKINLGNYEMAERFYSVKIDVSNLSAKGREKATLETESALEKRLSDWESAMKLPEK